MSEFIRIVVLPVVLTSFIWIGWSLNWWQGMAVLLLIVTFYAPVEDLGKLSGRLPKNENSPNTTKRK